MLRWTCLLALACATPAEDTAVTEVGPDADGDGVTVEAGDCDDHDATVSPLALDVVGDGVDRDCDGADGTDADGDGVANRATGGSDCDDAVATVFPGAPDGCNGVDDDCNGVVDDGTDHQTYHPDADGDGFGDPARSVTACAPPAGFVSDVNDCNDLDASAWPGAPEACDGVDDNCDGTVDGPGVQGWTPWYEDADGDGVGSDTVLVEGCSGPDGSVRTTGDCDDDDPARSPALPEVCDGVDNDCNEVADLGPPVWYADVDEDGFGDGATATCGGAPIDAVLNGNDCNDDDANSHPGGLEVCGGFDEDCDGLVDVEDDDVDAPIWFFDADGDGYGVTDSAIEACEAPLGTSDVGEDCDDHNDDAFPGADDPDGDGIDTNCDGEDGEA